MAGGEPIESYVIYRFWKAVFGGPMPALDERTWAILDHRYHGYNLEMTAQLFGLSRERVRQIEGKALMMFRHPGFRAPSEPG